MFVIELGKMFLDIFVVKLLLKDVNEMVKVGCN